MMSAEEEEASPACAKEPSGAEPQGGAAAAAQHHHTCGDAHAQPHPHDHDDNDDDDGGEGDDEEEGEAEEEEGDEEEEAGQVDGGRFRERPDGTGRNFNEEGGACSGAERTGEDATGKAAAINSSCSSETCIPTPSCRICFQGAEQGDLLNPCRCDGSVRYTHQHCLLKWISERGCWTCELCCYRFHVIAINMKRPCQWQSITITLVEKVQIIAVFLGSLFLVSSISWLLWSALSPQAVWQRRDVLFQICYGMYGFMDLVCVGLIAHEGAAVYNVFMRWRAVNLHWDVQSYEKATDMEDGGLGVGAAPGPRTLWLPLAPAGLQGPTQLAPQPWTCLCLEPLCPRLLPPHFHGQDANSGEVVIRVTSV